MITKKWTFILGLMAISGNTLLAQTSNVKKVKTNITRFQELGGAGAGDLSIKFLKESIDPIDKAVEHDKTKGEAETWALYSLVYSDLGFLEKNEEYINKTLTGIKKTTELDTEKKEEQNLEVARVNVRNFYQIVGYDKWQENDFKGAYEYFTKGLDFSPSDTTLAYFAGVAAVQNKDYKNAIKHYQSLLPVKDHSNHKVITGDIPKLYLSEGDTVKALEYAALAAVSYPEDKDIVTQNIELHLITGNEQKIIQELEKQTQSDPQNQTLFYYKGIAYSAVEEEEKAIEAYKKAVEIDPNFIDANLNLAAAMMMRSNKKIMALNDDRSISNADYNKRLGELKAEMATAVPYLEKAISLDPKNKSAYRNLKSYYDFVGDEAKSSEMQAKISEL